jgi:molybdopterin/thiamine biosynthesis adenylyltransferase
LNPNVECIAFKMKYESSVAMQLVEQSDIVIDATDNMNTRYLINDACVLGKKPLVSGAAQSMDGQVTVYNYLDAPCYRCMHPEPPPLFAQGSCSESGVLGAVPGVIGTLQAVEAVKVITGIGSALNKRLCVYDALDARFRIVNIRGKSEKCIVCGPDPSIKSILDSDAWSSGHALATCLDDNIKIQLRIAASTTKLAFHESISVIVSSNAHI